MQYRHPDRLGSTGVVTDGAGAEVQRLAYYPFGATRLDLGTVETPYQYTGQERDAYTGLLDYGARSYDPDLGRFLSPDPLVGDLADPQTLNPYSYVLNNPMRFTVTWPRGLRV